MSDVQQGSTCVEHGIMSEEQLKMTADDVMKEALQVFFKQISQSGPFVREVMCGDDPTGAIIRHQLRRDTHT